MQKARERKHIRKKDRQAIRIAAHSLCTLLRHLMMTHVMTIQTPGVLITSRCHPFFGKQVMLSEQQQLRDILEEES